MVDAVHVRIANLPIDCLDPLVDSEFDSALEGHLDRCQQVEDLSVRTANEIFYVIGVTTDTKKRSALMNLRRDIFNNRAERLQRSFSTIDFLPATARALASELLRSMSELMNESVELQQRYAQTIDRAWEQLSRLWNDEAVAQLLFFANDELRAKVAKSRRVNERRTHRDIRMYDSVIRYLLRAATKTTPLRLFSVSGVTGWSTEARSALTISPVVQGRLVLNWLGGWVCVTNAPLQGSDRIRVGLNPTLHRDGGNFTFWRFPFKDMTIVEERAHVPATNFLITVVNFLASLPAITLPVVATRLSETFRWPASESMELCIRLYGEGILFPTDGVPYDHPSEYRPSLHAVEPILVEQAESVSRLDDVRTVDFNEIAHALANRSPNWPPIGDNLGVVVDGVRKVHGALDRDIHTGLLRALRCYLRVVEETNVQRKATSYLTVATQIFLERYGPNTDVPLLACADWLDGATREELRRGTEPKYTFNVWPNHGDTPAYDRFIRYAFGDLQRRRTIVTHTDLDDWGFPERSLPPLDVTFRAFYDPDPKLALEMIAEPGVLLSRFDYLFGRDNEERGLLSQGPGRVLDKFGANHQDTILAELVLGASRVEGGNAGRRPPLVQHQIIVPPVQGHRAGSEILPLTDLYVSYLSQSKRLEVRSRLRGKRVAVLYGSVLGVQQMGLARILFELRDILGGVPQFRFSTAELESRTHSPRLSFEQLIVAPERWWFVDWPLVDAEPTFDQFRNLRAWCRRYNLPTRAFVRSVDDQKPQAVDFRNPLVMGSVLTSLRRSNASVLIVEEMLPPVDHLIVSCQDRFHAAEFTYCVEGDTGSL